jgi:hypothetical protein
MAIASLQPLFSRSRIRPRRHASNTRLAGKAIGARKALFPLIKWDECPGQKGELIEFENKKTAHAQEVRRAPLNPHLHAPARSTNQQNPRKGV